MTQGVLHALVTLQNPRQQHLRKALARASTVPTARRWFARNGDRCGGFNAGPALLSTIYEIVQFGVREEMCLRYEIRVHTTWCKKSTQGPCYAGRAEHSCTKTLSVVNVGIHGFKRDQISEPEDRTISRKNYDQVISADACEIFVLRLVLLLLWLLL